MEEILDNIPQEDKNKAVLKKKRVTLLIILAVLTLTSFLLAPIGFAKRPMYGPEGEERFAGMLIAGTAIWGFILGLLLAIIPFRKLPYKQKYLTASLFGMCIIQFLITATVIMNVIY